MKLECDPASFESDSEGLQLAGAINEHLPTEACYCLVPRKLVLSLPLYKPDRCHACLVVSARPLP